MKSVSLVLIAILVCLPHQGKHSTLFIPTWQTTFPEGRAVTKTFTTTLFYYREGWTFPSPTQSNTYRMELIPFGTARDGSETTFSALYTHPIFESDGSAQFTMTAEGEPIRK